MIPNAKIVDLLRADTRRRKRRATLADLITAYITSAILALVNGWFLMLAVGVARDEWLTNLPTVGYWWAVLLVYLLQGVFSRVPPSKSKREAS